MILIEVGLKGNEVARTTQYVNWTEVPSLCPDWQIFVQRCVRSFLADRSPNQEPGCIAYQRQLIRHLELVISIYVQERLIRTRPITWDRLLSDLEEFAAALTPILEKLNKLSPADPVWGADTETGPARQPCQCPRGHRRPLRERTRSVGVRQGREGRGERADLYRSVDRSRKCAGRFIRG